MTIGCNRKDVWQKGHMYVHMWITHQLATVYTGGLAGGGGVFGCNSRKQYY